MHVHYILNHDLQITRLAAKCTSAVSHLVEYDHNIGLFAVFPIRLVQSVKGCTS